MKFNTANLTLHKRYRFKLLTPDGTPAFEFAGNLSEMSETTLKITDYQYGHLPQMGDLTVTIDGVSSIENFTGNAPLDWRIIPPPGVGG